MSRQVRIGIAYVVATHPYGGWRILFPGVASPIVHPCSVSLFGADEAVKIAYREAWVMLMEVAPHIFN